jgi:DNA-directed RNA polymerase specialized sigma24 family protein
MSKYSDKTSIGGSKESFQTTHWSEIFDAKTADDIRRSTITDALLHRYWKPVYCYIRRKGYDNEQAKDLTQGFFHEVVLNSNLIRQADQTKGRFRTFLLTALDHYLIDVHRKEKARKHTPRGGFVALEGSDLSSLTTAHSSMTPDQLFNYVWAAEMIDQVISQVKKECCDTGKEKHWNVFHAKILAPIIDNRASPSLKELCGRYGIENEAKASNMIITIKRCFRRVLEDHLRCFVRTDSEIEDEFNELLGIISRGRAG